MRNKHKEKAQQEFSARFCKALSNMGYSPSQQNVLGRLFGVSGQAVRKWAEGAAMPNTARLPHIASVLGVRRAWLQDGEEPMMPDLARVSEPGRGGKRGEEIAISAEEARMLYNFRALTAAQKDAVRNLIILFSEKNRA